MFKFIMAVECPVCGELVRDTGFTVDFTTNAPVVNLELFSQQSFFCEECKTNIYTGDMEMVMDFETVDDDDDDEVEDDE